MEGKMRPGWQIDLKWIAGIFACVAIFVAGVLFSLAEITERGRAEPLSAAFVGFLLDDRVTDDEFEAVQAQAAADPSGLVSLSPLDLDVRGSQIAGLDREEASLLVAGEFAAVLYAGGSEAADALILEPGPNADGEPQEAINLGPTSSLTAESHSTFRTLFFVALAIVIALLGLVSFLSRGLGRLGAPAMVLALSTAPLAGRTLDARRKRRRQSRRGRGDIHRDRPPTDPRYGRRSAQLLRGGAQHSAGLGGDRLRRHAPDTALTKARPQARLACGEHAAARGSRAVCLTERLSSATLIP